MDLGGGAELQSTTTGDDSYDNRKIVDDGQPWRIGNSDSMIIVSAKYSNRRASHLADSTLIRRVPTFIRPSLSFIICLTMFCKFRFNGLHPVSRDPGDRRIPPDYPGFGLFVLQNFH